MFLFLAFLFLIVIGLALLEAANRRPLPSGRRAFRVAAGLILSASLIVAGLYAIAPWLR
jgi:hypothetical protein